jgi:hypothetical protein
MAIPSLFSPVKVGPRLRQRSFVGGALGANNPTRELLNEASIIFGKDMRVAQIISIGSGLSHVPSVKSPEGEKTDYRPLAAMMVDCETVARELAARLYNFDGYLRLNVDRGMDTIKMADWDELGIIETYTNAYLGTVAVTRALDGSLQRLRGRVGFITLGQISKYLVFNVNMNLYI